MAQGRRGGCRSIKRVVTSRAPGGGYANLLELYKNASGRYHSAAHELFAIGSWSAGARPKTLAVYIWKIANLFF